MTSDEPKTLSEIQEILRSKQTLAKIDSSLWAISTMLTFVGSSNRGHSMALAILFRETLEDVRTNVRELAKLLDVVPPAKNGDAE